MWFFYALLTALCWGGADLFYKKGSGEEDRTSHIKIVIMVGLVMGLHAVAYMAITRTSFHPIEMIRYLPVSALYILSMAVGYVGLRYLELSISSPVQNSSGAVAALLCFVFFAQTLGWLEIVGMVIVTAGVVGLAVLEKRQERRITLIQPEDGKYHKGLLAIAFPILYCVLDGLGTFADAVYLDEMQLISETDALLAYEFTFALVALLAFFYLRFIEKEKFRIIEQKHRAAAALLETAGQFFYVYAMSGRAIVAAPLIASYSIFSVLLSRIFLKEKLRGSQYAVVIVVLIGIAVLGLSEEL